MVRAGEREVRDEREDGGQVREEREGGRWRGGQGERGVQVRG